VDWLVEYQFLLLSCHKEMMYFHDLKAKNKTDCHHQILTAAAAPLILFMISVDWI
jgi:hypothetical protein